MHLVLLSGTQYKSGYKKWDVSIPFFYGHKQGNGCVNLSRRIATVPQYSAIVLRMQATVVSMNPYTRASANGRAG